MTMKNAESPEHYVRSLDGWRRKSVDGLRRAVLAVPGIEETLKWGHLVYECNGPALLIRAEAERVLFGFWRGKRLREIEPRLRASGKYEMATLELREGMTLAAAVARRLAREAVALNWKLGDPRSAAGTAAKSRPRRRQTTATEGARPRGRDGVRRRRA
jgi:hypothetical protein